VSGDCLKGDTSLFQVSQHVDFCYGHRLLNDSGKFRNLQGHNGRVVIVLESDHLDSREILMDFSGIKKVVRAWIDEQLDHRIILHENDPALTSLQQLGEPRFNLPANPTAEIIAKTIFQFTNSQVFPVIKVSLWETPNAHATYRG